MATEGRVVETSTGEIDLPDLPDTGVCPCVVRKLTTKSLYCEDSLQALGVDNIFKMAMKAVLYGNRTQNKQIQNSAIGFMFYYCSSLQRLEILDLIDEVWEGTPPKHPMRKLFALLSTRGVLCYGVVQDLVHTCDNDGPPDAWPKGLFNKLLRNFNKYEDFFYGFWCQAALVDHMDKWPENASAYLVE